MQRSIGIGYPTPKDTFITQLLKEQGRNIVKSQRTRKSAVRLYLLEMTTGSFIHDTLTMWLPK